MWQFKDKKDLMAVAFIDAETYIHSARSIRGLILISDISRSVQLLQYQVLYCVTCGTCGTIVCLLKGEEKKFVIN